MAIHEYYSRKTRQIIGFFDEDPPDDAVSALSGFDIRRLDESNLIDPIELANVAAVVFRQQPNSPSKIKHDLKEHAEFLLWHDCRVFVRACQKEAGSERPYLRHLVIQALAEGRLPASGLMKIERASVSDSEKDAHLLTPMIHVLTDYDPWSDIAVHLRKFPPGEPPSPDLKITDGSIGDVDSSWSPEAVKLIQRSFHDCSKVILSENSAGLSGVRAYRAFAIRKEHYVGEELPYEYFVKIGERQKISDEYLAYRDSALEHIPFHLGPRLRLDRCALGTKEGIIVSDYVSGTESLRDCARDGRAVPVIASLFNTSLRSWRDGSTAQKFPLREFLENKMPEEIPEHRRPLIEAHGSVRTPDELGVFLRKTPSDLVQVGVIHGDLHAMNVLVRAGDAILIDFEKLVRRAPLLFDVASIEAGLFVSGFIGDTRSGAEVLCSVKKLYEIDALVLHQFSPCNPSNASAWFFDCVRQIRMQGRQIEPSSTQYAFVLAVVLIKKACNPNDFCSNTDAAEQPLNEEQVRSLAYILGEQILLEISKIDKEPHT